MSTDLWGYGVHTAAYKLFDPRDDPHYFDGLDYDPSDDDEDIHSDLVTSWVIGNGMSRRKPHIQRGAEQGPPTPDAPLTDTERWMQNMGHEFAKRIYTAPPTEGYTYRGMTVSPDWVANAKREKSVTLPLSSIDYDLDYSSSYTSPRVTRRPGVGVLMRIEPGAKAYHLAESEHITHGDFDVHDMHHATPEECDQYGIEPHTVVMHARQRSVPAPVGSRTAHRTAMPAIDAYDDDPQYDDDYNPIPGTQQFPWEHRYEDQEIQPGPYYHATDQEFKPGDIIQSYSQLHGHQGGGGIHADWVWMGRDPDTALGHAGPHLYEVEPMDEGPWEWNHDIFSHPGDDGRYVSPRARVVRVVPHNYPFWENHKHASRTAMPMREIPQFGHQLPHVGPLPGADPEQGHVDSYWVSGGCGTLALAFKNMFPDLKIGAEITRRKRGYYYDDDDDEDNKELAHVWVHDGTHAHDGFGTHVNSPDAWAGSHGGEIDLDVDPQRVADKFGLDWSPDDDGKWNDPHILDASEVIQNHWFNRYYNPETGEDQDHPYKEARTMTAAVTVYTKPSCPQCDMTHKLLNKLGVEHTTVDVTADPEAHAYVTGLGYQQAPVVVVGDGEDHWGGFSPDKLKGLVSGE